jgi:uncharacterized damage-inducible protein DinB
VLSLPTIRELVVFARINRTRFAQRIAAVPPNETDQKKATGGPSLAGVLAEMINREDWIVNALLRGMTWPPPKKATEFPGMEAMIAWMKEVEARTDAYLDATAEAGLKRPITALLDARTSTLLGEEWLFQLFTDQLYGLGQISMLMRQMSIEPPTIQWSAFRRPA